MGQIKGTSRHGSTSTADSVFVRGGGNRGGRPFPQYRGNKSQRGSGTRGQPSGVADRGWGFPDTGTGEQPGPRGSGRKNRPSGNHRPRGGRGGRFKYPACFYCKGTDYDERDCPKNEFRNQQERRADQRDEKKNSRKDRRLGRTPLNKPKVKLIRLMKNFHRLQGTK